MALGPVCLEGPLVHYNWRAVSVALGPVGLCLEGPLVHYNWRAVSVALGPVCLEGPLVHYNCRAVSVALGPVGLCLEGPLENPNCSRLMMMPTDAASLCVQNTRARCNDVNFAPPSSNLPRPPRSFAQRYIRVTAHRPHALPRTAKLGRH